MKDTGLLWSGLIPQNSYSSTKCEKGYSGYDRNVLELTEHPSVEYKIGLYTPGLLGSMSALSRGIIRYDGIMNHIIF